MRLSSPHVNCTTKKRRRERTSSLVQSKVASAEYFYVLYRVQKRPKLQDFCLSAASGAAKFATKTNSCAQGLCLARKITLQRSPSLLHQVAPVILGDFLPMFQLFAFFTLNHVCCT